MDRDYYKKYEFLERNHWWYIARQKILKALMKKYLDENIKYNILNIGAATGQTSLMANSFGCVTSLEYDEPTFKILKEKSGITAVLGSITEMPFKNSSFDVILCFDVLEHIEEENKALDEIKRCLKPDGTLFMTVPAYQFLWSHHDREMHHKRRYTLSRMKNLLSNKGMQEIRTTYFNTILFFPIALVRTFQKLFKIKGRKSDYEMSSKPINSLFYKIFILERSLLKRFNFFFGVSIFCAYKKIYNE